ncbi:MAG: helix-turn-helix transcriptional regulator [Caldilineaceae bacterium]
MKRFGEKLRTLRSRRNMTLRELSDRLGFRSHGFVGDLETGRKKPSVELVVEIARLFDVCVDQLVKDELEVD